MTDQFVPTPVLIPHGLGRKLRAATCLVVSCKQFVNNSASGIVVSLVINRLNSRERIHQKIVYRAVFRDFRCLEIESGVAHGSLGEDGVSCKPVVTENQIRDDERRQV